MPAGFSSWTPSRVLPTTPPHWLPKAPVTSLPLRKVCSGVKQKAATLPPQLSSVSLGSPQPAPGHPKKPLQAAHSPEAPLSHPTLQRHLACLPPSRYEFHCCGITRGQGPGLGAHRGAPSTDTGWLSSSGETASSPCTSVPPAGLTRRGGLHVSRWRFPSLPFHSRRPPLENTSGGRPWPQGSHCGASGTQGLLPRFSRALLTLAQPPVPAASRAVPRAGPDCRAQTLGEPCAVRVVASGTGAAL